MESRSWRANGRIRELFPIVRSFHVRNQFPRVGDGQRLPHHALSPTESLAHAAVNERDARVRRWQVRRLWHVPYPESGEESSHRRLGARLKGVDEIAHQRIVFVARMWRQRSRSLEVR